jgi:hypothetical protein
LTPGYGQELVRVPIFQARVDVAIECAGISSLISKNGDVLLWIIEEEQWPGLDCSYGRALRGFKIDRSPHAVVGYQLITAAS